MTRPTGRSRGCQTCRQRKIKCDEKLPECSQCLRGGRICPGALTGALFITVNAEAATPNKPNKKDNSKTIAAQILPATHHGSSGPVHIKTIQHDESGRRRREGKDLNDHARSVAGSKPNDVLRTSTKVTAQFQLPTLYQPSRIVPFQQLFLRHFIDFFFNPEDKVRMNSWVLELPKLLDASPYSTVWYSLRAATMAIYSKLTGDRSIEFESCRWYDRGLESQRLQLQTMVQQRKRVLDESTILVPLLFCMFEVVMDTEEDAWIGHTQGAEKLFDMIGPQRCQIGQMHDLFRSARISAMYVAMISNKPSIFASDAWCTVPFEHEVKSPSDYLLDLLLQVPYYMKASCKMIQLSIRDPSASAAVKEDMRMGCQRLISQLDCYWIKYRDQINKGYDYARYSEPRDPRRGDSETYPCFQDSLAAILIGQFDAAKIILNSLLAFITPDPRIYGERVILHATSALAAVRYQEVQGITTGATTFMVFPLKVVGRCSLSDAHKEEARETLRRWGLERGVTGVSSPLPDVPDPSSRKMYPELIREILVELELGLPAADAESGSKQ